MLHEHRGVRHKHRLPRLTLSTILSWAGAHRRRAGRLPTKTSGPVMDSPGDTWMAVHLALRMGYRGLPGGSSLAMLLEGERKSAGRVPYDPVETHVTGAGQSRRRAANQLDLRHVT